MIKKTKEEKAEISRVNGSMLQPEHVYPKADKQDYIEPNEFDLSELYSSKAKYTAEQKLSAVTAYVMTGTVRGVMRLTGLKQQLISDWKNNSAWWNDAYASVLKKKQEEADGIMTSIIHLAATETIDRILNGDEVLNKNNELIRRKMGGKELATTMGITFDKRALIRGEPTSRSAKTDTTQTIAALKEEFAKMADEVLNTKVIN